MKWRTKNKTAWVLIVDDFDVFKQFPVGKFAGSEFAEQLIELNVHWQIEILEKIRIRYGNEADIFIYTKKNQQSMVKKVIAKFPRIKKTIIKKLAVKPVNIFETIISEKLDNYLKVTVWNLESLLITTSLVDNSADRSGSVIIKSPRERLLLISSSLENRYRDEKTDFVTVPSIYDLESIRETIYYMSDHDSAEYSLRAGKIAGLFLLIPEGQQRWPVSRQT